VLTEAEAPKPGRRRAAVPLEPPPVIATTPTRIRRSTAKAPAVDDTRPVHSSDTTGGPDANGATGNGTSRRPGIRNRAPADSGDVPAAQTELTLDLHPRPE
jgi:hypothetical protein